MANSFGATNFSAAVTATDLAISGDLTGTGSFANKLWSRSWGAQEVYNISAGTLASTAHQAGDVVVPYIPFDYTASEAIAFCLGVPDDYDGSELTFTLYWTVRSGVTGDVKWAINVSCFGDDDPMGATNTGAAVTDSYIADGDVHVCTIAITPQTSTAGSWLTCYLRRLPAEAADTMAADADFMGVRVEYS